MPRLLHCLNDRVATALVVRPPQDCTQQCTVVLCVQISGASGAGVSRQRLQQEGPEATDLLGEWLYGAPCTLGGARLLAAGLSLGEPTLRRSSHCKACWGRRAYLCSLAAPLAAASCCVCAGPKSSRLCAQEPGAHRQDATV